LELFEFHIIFLPLGVRNAIFNDISSSAVHLKHKNLQLKLSTTFRDKPKMKKLNKSLDKNKMLNAE